jgi:hypothetical protein
MSLRITVLRVALILAFQFASLTVGNASWAQQLPPCKSKQDADYIRLSTPVVKAWEQIPVGSAVYALDDAAGTKDWLKRALIQRVDAQTGIWNIWMEPSYSVFRIYPYQSKNSPQPCVYQGIVLKVNGILTVDDLLAAVRNRTTTTKIDSYDVFGGDGVGVQRYSRAATRAVTRR